MKNEQLTHDAVKKLYADLTKNQGTENCILDQKTENTLKELIYLRLNDKEKFIIKSKYEDNETFEKIAETIGTTTGCTYSMYNRIKYKLNLYLDKINDTDDIYNLNLTTRTYNILLKNNINKISELITKTKLDLLQLNGISARSVDNIVENLKDYGLVLRSNSNNNDNRKIHGVKYGLELLMADVYNVDSVTLSDDEELRCLEVLISIFNEFMITIVKYKYGIGVCKETNVSMAKRFNKSAGRIGQIHHKALRLLRHPARLEYIKTGYNEHTNSTIHIDDCIECLNLSTRAYVCLKRAYINTVSELKEKSKEDLLKIRNLGTVGLKDICDKLMKHGIILDSNNMIYPDNIESLNISVRSYNALTDVGINTISELSKKSKEDLLKIRNFGNTSLKDVCDKLIKRGIILKDY